MGWIAPAYRNVSKYASIAVTPFQDARPQAMETSYDGFVREGYQANELVYMCIELRANSASEPQMHANVRGTWTHDAPMGSILDLLRNPNPWMEGPEFFGNVIMHLDLAGNAFAIKERSASKKAVELWLLRPDQVKVVPSRTRYISHYELDLGAGDSLKLPVEDIIHWKTRSPKGSFYGQPPLMAAAGRVDIDNYMRTFVRAYFDHAGVPGGILSIEGNLTDDQRKEIKYRANSATSGPSGWHSWLVLDKKTTFTPVTSNLGNSGLVVPDLEKISSRRIPGVFQVPGAMIGVNDDNTSYASMDVIERHFWNGLRQLYKRLEGPLNSGPQRYAGQPMTGLTQDFPGVVEVAFDLSTVRALQADQDKTNARERADMSSTGQTIEEFRTRTGREPNLPDGTILIPANMIPAQVKGGVITVAGLAADGAAAGAADAGGGTDVQALALNGAQIASLLEVIQQVSAGTLSPDTAKVVLTVSFPSIPKETIDSMVTSAAATPAEGQNEPATTAAGGN